MGTNDAMTLALCMALYANRKTETIDKTDDPIVNLAVRAYWNGVQNMASKVVDVLDGVETPTESQEYIKGYADELVSYIRAALRGEGGDGA